MITGKAGKPFTGVSIRPVFAGCTKVSARTGACSRYRRRSAESRSAGGRPGRIAGPKSRRASQRCWKPSRGPIGFLGRAGCSTRITGFTHMCALKGLERLGKGKGGKEGGGGKRG